MPETASLWVGGFFVSAFVLWGRGWSQDRRLLRPGWGRGADRLPVLRTGVLGGVGIRAHSELTR